jgi:hypothetical protein
MHDDEYAHIEAAIAHHRGNRFEAALQEFDAALAIYESAYTRAPRAQVLLSLGRYQEGFKDFQSRWVAFRRVAEPATRDMLMRSPRWRGEELRSRRIILVHEQGFGDTIQLLRFVPELQAMGADVVLFVPPPLHRLAAQLAPIADSNELADFVCPFFDLPMLLGTTPGTVPKPPYLRAGRSNKHWRLGIAWSSAREKVPNDINREIPIWLLPLESGSTVSLQKHDADVARAHGVEAPDYTDFADVAAVINACDTIVSVDTGPLHLVGAIGHPKTFALLPYVSSWRWRNGNPWYPQIKLCIDGPAGDWSTALATLKNGEIRHANQTEQG